MLSPETMLLIEVKLRAVPSPGADYLADVPLLMEEIQALSTILANVQGEAASALATKNVAKEILTVAKIKVDKQIKINNIEDDKGRPMVDGTLVDLQARLESALRVL